MNKRWCYFLFLLWITIVIAAQVLLFTNGFLLTRVTQFYNASCVPVTETNCNSTDTSRCMNERLFHLFHDYVLNEKVACLEPRSKVILLILDAFRYDFALYNKTLSDPLTYQNKLPVISNHLNAQPNNTRLYKFIADPPTTTMQRLKGLTTGSLPTFIDAGSNFATHEINEDNLIDQLNSHGYKAIFMGDDTWNGLYPYRFLRNYPYPSFNVWDLDTVDNGVKENLFPEMKKNDWHLLIGHFLGVDHCGHRYGPNHPEMERKLTEMNEVIEKVIQNMDQQTTLFVIGDHGMTSTGDHGGESKNEITAALFAYSKMEFTSAYYENNATIKQVDLVPTLSTILGIPIPYSNLGSVAYDLLPIQIYDLPHWNYDIFAAWSNIQQITTYIKEYSKNSDTFNSLELEKIYKQYEEFKTVFFNIQDPHDLVVKVNRYVKLIRLMCEKVWIQFDAFSMARALLLVSHVTIFTFILVEGLSNEAFERILNKEFIIFSYSTTIAGYIISAVLYSFNITHNLMNSFYFMIGLFCIVILAALCLQNFQLIAAYFYDASKNRKWTSVVFRSIIAFSSVMLLSNSFILEEAKVMLFFLLTSTLIIIVEYYLLKTSKGKDLSIKYIARSKMLVIGFVICTLIRLSMYFWRCREEQGCSNLIFAKSDSNRIEWIITIISLALFVTASRTWLRSCGNLNGSSITILLARYAPTVIIICSVGFWVVHGLPNDTKIKLIGPWQPDMFAWVVYLLIMLGFLSVIYDPLCIYQLIDRKGIEVDTRIPNLIPQLAKHIFKEKEEKEQLPMVFGLATVYSAGVLVVTINIILLWALLLGEIIIPAAISIIFVMAFILVVSSIIRCESSQKVSDLLDVPTNLVVTWFVVSVYLFYATGHQPSFPNIAWEAAFVGTGGVFNYNFIPATLIIIHTFGSYIIAGITLPLILIAPFSLYVMMPNKKLKIDLSKGDMVLYDYDQIALPNLFRLCCKYIQCHAIRVFCSMLASTIHCRHLMVWNIFAPKLIFESVSFFITIVSVLLGYLLVIHISNRVDRYVKKLTKQSC